MNKQDWTYKKLGEICDIYGRIGFRGYTREDYVNTIEEGAISLSPSNIINNRLDFSNCTYITWDKYNQSPEIMISKGDVIFVKTASVGKCAFVSELPHESTINPQFVVFKNIKISNRFLFHELLSPTFQYKVQRIKSGTSVPTITQKGLSELEISYPPIEEQERIVEELDLLQGIIEKKKEQLKAYDQLAQSIFYTMFGDPIDNPKGWEVTTIGDTCSITCGQDYKSVEDENGKYPIYGTGGIMGWANQFKCPKNSIIIGRKGNINNPILVDVDFWNVDTAFGVTPNNEMLSAIYFFFFCKEYDFTQHDVSVTIPSLRRTDILKIKLPVPPLSLQQEFAEKVEAIERQKALVQQSIEETQTMFDCTMDKYFG